MAELAELIRSHEEWLMARILYYAKRQGYTVYTSTLAEAWRASICGLSGPLIEVLERSEEVVPEFGPETDFRSDPIAAFGIVEAQKHRSRGITLAMFLGLMKYYREAYQDLLSERSNLAAERRAHFRLYIDRFFDRVELGFASEWSAGGIEDKLTELLDANRLMTNEKNKYLTAFESLQDPVVLFNESGLVENANHAAARTFAGLGVPGALYYSGETQHWLGDKFSEFFAEADEEREFSSYLETVDKGLRIFDIKLKPMLDVSEKFRGTVMLLTDVTEEAEARNALAHARDTLERQVQRRTVELEHEIEEHQASEETLLRTVDQLARSNTELERFAFVASHDLREPLRGIISYAQFLDRRYRGKLDDDADEFIDYIVGNAKRMNALVADLLTYSRIATRGAPFTAVPAQGAMQIALDSLRETIRDSGATISALDLPEVLADQVQLAEVFEHLIANAIKFRHPDRPPRVTIAAKERSQDWLFTVTDNGIGIDPAYAGSVFDIFRRLHTTERYPGTGIGLSIVKRIIERHGGTIWADGAPGQGASFHFNLPKP